MTLASRFTRQFAHPTGLLGRFAGTIMDHRPSNRARNDWTIELLELAPTHQVLELGHGPGYALEKLLGRVPAGLIVGIDHSRLMHAQAARRLATAIRAGRLELQVTALDAMPDWIDRFDRILSANVLQFCQDRAALFRRLHRCLKPDGRIATTYQPRHAGATDADAIQMGDRLMEEMRTAGLNALRVEQGPATPLLTICAIGERKR